MMESSIETATKWIGGLKKQYISERNKTSRWTETRSPINFLTSMTGCSPQHLAANRSYQDHSKEGNSCFRNANRRKIKGCTLIKFLLVYCISTVEFIHRQNAGGLPCVRIWASTDVRCLGDCAGTSSRGEAGNSGGGGRSVVCERWGWMDVWSPLHCPTDVLPCSVQSPARRLATAALQRFNIADAGDSLALGIGAIGWSQQQKTNNKHTTRPRFQHKLITPLPDSVCCCY